MATAPPMRATLSIRPRRKSRRGHTREGGTDASFAEHSSASPRRRCHTERTTHKEELMLESLNGRGSQEAVAEQFAETPFLPTGVLSDETRIEPAQEQFESQEA